MPDEELKKMIADHMEAGFLENIIDMFRRDRSLFGLLGCLISDERARVRLGAVALVEALKESFFRDAIVKEVSSIAGVLKNPEAVIRADAAYLLGVIGDKSALPFLRDSVNDENAAVREVLKETIEELSVPVI